MSKKKAEIANVEFKIDPRLGGLFQNLQSTPNVGDRENYNFQPGVSPYVLWPFFTIEWEPDENRYRARVIVKHKDTSNLVAFNSLHQDYSDAERAIDNLRESLAGTSKRPIYNIYGETISVRTTAIPSGGTWSMEVQVLIISMNEVP